MSIQTFFKQLDDLDILYRNALVASGYQSQFRIDYPVDRSYDDSGYYIEYALVDAELNDIRVTKTNDELFVTYHPPKDSPEGRTYLDRKIVKRGFDHAYRISSKLNLGELSTTYQNGLLKIKIPWAESALPKEVEIVNLNKSE